MDSATKNRKYRDVYDGTGTQTSLEETKTLRPVGGMKRTDREEASKATKESRDLWEGESEDREWWECTRRY